MIFISIQLISSCDSNIDPSYSKETFRFRNSPELDQVEVTTGVEVPKSGEELVISNAVWGDGTKVTIDGREIETIGKEDGQVAVIIPEGLVQKLNVSVIRNGVISTMDNVFSLDTTECTLILSPQSSICSDQLYCDQEGVKRFGTRQCLDPLAETNLKPENIKAGVSIAGVSGGIDLSQVAPENIKTGVSIAGVSGNITPSPASCSADGISGCVTSSSYTSASTTGLSNKVLAGQSVGGVNGNVTLPNASDVRSSISYGISGTSLTGTIQLPLASNVGTGVNYGAAGTELTGTAAVEAHVDCTVDGTQGCVANNTFFAATACSSNGDNDCFAAAAGSYDAADLTNLSAGNIKAGVTIAGQTGEYPSATHRLAANTGATDLTSLGSATTPGAYEFFDSAGAVYSTNVAAGGSVSATTTDQVFSGASTVYNSFTVTGDTDLVASNIVSSIDILGVTGNVTLPAAGKVLTATSFGAADASSGTLTLPGAGKVLTGSGSYGDPGSAVTPTLTLPTASNVLTGSGLYGDPGAQQTPSYSPDFPDVANVLSTDTVDSASGTLTLPAAGTVLASTSYGVAGNGSTGTLTLPGAGKVLTGSGSYGDPGSAVTPTLTLPTASNVLTGSGLYGDPGAQQTPSYSPDFPDVANVLSTDTVDSASGTLTLPAAGTVLASTSYGVAGNGSTGTLTLPGAGKVLTGSGSYGDPGSAVTPTLTLPTASNVLTGSGLYGDPGAQQTPSYSPDFPDVGNVLSTDTVDSASGTLTLPAAGIVLASTTYGVAGNGSTGTLTLPGAGKVLTGSGSYGDPGSAVTPTLTLPTASNVLTGSGLYGDPGAQQTPSYSPDFPDVANVLSTDTVDSASGTLTLPAAGTVLASTSYGVAGNGSTGSLTLPGAGKVLTGSGSYGDPGSAVTPTLTLPTASNVLTGSGLYGDPGAQQTPSYSPDFPDVGNVLSSDTVDSASGTLTLPSASNVLSGSGDYGVAGTSETPSYSPDFPAASNVLDSDTTNSVTGTIATQGSWNLTTSFPGAGYYTGISNAPAAGDLKRTIQVNGVTGDFPSSSSPLPRYSSNSGASTATTGSDQTDLTNFITQVKTDGTFEYWDSQGVRRTGSGDNDITNANVASGIDFENLSITGSAATGSDCTGDGQTGCLTTTDL